jgi:hypothetical protein
MVRPTSQLGDLYGDRIILAATSGRYKAATNFVIFVLAENDNNNEKDDLDFARFSRHSPAADSNSKHLSVR